MMLKKAVGRGSTARKYDLLTILSAFALSQDRSLQRQTLRLVCLITARYNWQNDYLSIGHVEIAKLWSCDPRTVKREMAVFRQRGWLVEQRPAARGRVAQYGLGIERIMLDTKVIWEQIGPDLVERLQPVQTPVEDVNVIPFRQTASLNQPLPMVWQEISQLLEFEDQAMYRVWFEPLQAQVIGEDLILTAPGSYHARYVATHLLGRIQAHVVRLSPKLRIILK